ncbi:MAG: leucine-rich repeat domain-containing protein [Roseburia sp.]|nr:leucine-rich repeat domain-containing protein [Roseburia sp.]
MYKLEWEKTNDGNVRLLGVAEMPSELTLPEEIEGLPLTEVGPYCFAKNKYLERISLPDTITKIDRMAFYNCTGLKELEMGAGLVELGSDAFMNCYNLHRLMLRCGALEKSGVRLILHQMSSDMTVHFIGNQNRQEATILFPEYYESYDEVTPAHLFGRNIEGEGFRARQFFKDGIFEYGRYDEIFRKACAEESERTLCEMALNRLQYPVGLSESAKEQYEDYVRVHMENICQKAVQSRDLDRLEFLCKNKLAGQSDVENCARLAAEYEWAEGGAYMLRLKAQYFSTANRVSRYEFDDF